MGITLDSSAVERAWESSGRVEFGWMLRCARASRVLPALTAAVEAANERAEARWGPAVNFSEAPQVVPRGLVAFMSRTGTEEELREYLGWIVTSLEAADVTGVLTASRPVSLPMPPRVRGIQTISALVALEQGGETDARRRSWARSDLEAVGDWSQRRLVAPGSMPLMMKSYGFHPTSRDRVGRELIDLTLEEGLATAATVTGGQDPSLTVVHAKRLGVFGVAHLALNGTWHSDVVAARDVLVQWSGRTRLGMVRAASEASWTMADYLGDQDGKVSIWAQSPPGEVDDILPDVSGVMLLQAALVRRVADLTGWKTTDLDNGRVLVEAQDLEPWFTSVAPDQEVLAAARAQFAPIMPPPTKGSTT